MAIDHLRYGRLAAGFDFPDLPFDELAAVGRRELADVSRLCAIENHQHAGARLAHGAELANASHQLFFLRRRDSDVIMHVIGDFAHEGACLCEGWKKAHRLKPVMGRTNAHRDFGAEPDRAEGVQQGMGLLATKCQRAWLLFNGNDAYRIDHAVPHRAVPDAAEPGESTAKVAADRSDCVSCGEHRQFPTPGAGRPFYVAEQRAGWGPRDAITDLWIACETPQVDNESASVRREQAEVRGARPPGDKGDASARRDSRELDHVLFADRAHHRLDAEAFALLQGASLDVTLQNRR